MECDQRGRKVRAGPDIRPHGQVIHCGGRQAMKRFKFEEFNQKFIIMKNSDNFPFGNRLKKLAALLAFSAIILACENEKVEDSNIEIADASVHSLNTVKVTSTGMNFDAPDEIPAGWTTFQYMNKTGMVHFFLLQKLPEGKDLSNSLNEVVPFFQAGLDYYREGDLENAFQTPLGFNGLPDWYQNVQMNGGPGLISGGGIATTTVFLEEGTYVLECYVKSPDGKFHSFTGMIDQLIVTGEATDQKEPKADVAIILKTSAESERRAAPESDIQGDWAGMELVNAPKRPGRHTFSVEFMDQSTYGNLLQHDVHLIKADESVTDADLEKLNKWMNWFYVVEDMEGLIYPAPQGFTFLGGIQELHLDEGETRKGYFSAVLTPGRYILMSEIDDAIGRKMFVEFDVE